MSRRDIYHNTVKIALQKDGWTITHDPFPLQIGNKRLSVDLGAERLISAEKGTAKIVVEVKSFVSASDVKDLFAIANNFCFNSRLLFGLNSDSKYQQMLMVYLWRTRT